MFGLGFSVALAALWLLANIAGLASDPATIGGIVGAAIGGLLCILMEALS